MNQLQVLALFDNINAQSRGSAIIEILILLFISAVLGYLLRGIYDQKNPKEHGHDFDHKHKERSSKYDVGKAIDDDKADLKKTSELDYEEFDDEALDGEKKGDSDTDENDEDKDDKDDKEEDKPKTADKTDKAEETKDDPGAAFDKDDEESDDNEKDAQINGDEEDEDSAEKEDTDNEEDEEKPDISHFSKPPDYSVEDDHQPKTNSRGEAGEVDDLRQVEGVGPKIAEILEEAGIASFGDLADADPKELKKILSDAGSRYKLHDPSSWPKQAELAADGQWDELHKLQKKVGSKKKS